MKRSFLVVRLPLAGMLALLGLAGALAAPACSDRKDRQSPDELRAEIAALEKERDLLRPKLDQLVAKDPRISGMPKTPVRVGVPTTLARDLVERVTSGFIDHVTLELKNLKVNKTGSVKKVVTIGQYELHVLIKRVSGRLKTGKPRVTFGGNRVELSMPVTVASGTGNATINFKWDGKGMSDAVCGDMEITRDVSGGVKPASYPVSGALVLTATAKEILAEPKFPLIKINLKVDPSDESWASVQKILDDQEGICGYVVDKVNILKIVQGLIDKGFNVRLPTEKIKPMAIPVGIEPNMNVKGRQVALGIKVGELAITNDMIWLGAHLKVDVGAAGSAPAGASPDPSASPSASPAATATAKPKPAATPKPKPATPPPPKAKPKTETVPKTEPKPGL
jgi:hypothetical protein